MFSLYLFWVFLHIKGNKPVHITGGHTGVYLKMSGLKKDTGSVEGHRGM